MIVGICIGYYIMRNNQSPTSVITTGKEPPVNLDPPTKADAERVEDTKQKIVDKQSSGTGSTTLTGAKKTVKVAITYAGQYGQTVEVGAEVAVFEEGGTCTIKFSLGTSSFTKTVQAIQNVNRVNCPAVIVNSSEFNPKGAWSVMASYSSNTSSGSSDISTVGVK